MSDDEYDGFRNRRQARMRLVAWVVIIALVLVGGGATVLALLFN
ncbi:MAG: hypothetical protein QM626_11645 [Microbacterium sp.]